MLNLSRLVVDHTKLKQLLRNPEVIPRMVGINHPARNDSQLLKFQFDLDEPWLYYKSIAHDTKQLKAIPRNMFSFVFSYIEQTATTLPTCIERYDSIMMDLYIAGHALLEEELSAIVNSFTTLNVNVDELLKKWDDWPIVDWKVDGHSAKKLVSTQFLTFLVKRYGELGESAGIETILLHSLDGKYLPVNDDNLITAKNFKLFDGVEILSDRLRVSILNASVSQMLPKNSPLPRKVLASFALNSVLIDWEMQKTVASYLNEVFDATLAQKVILILIHSLMKSRNCNADLNQTILNHCKRFRLYIEADILWLYATKIKKWKERITRIFVPLETTVMYCEMLLDQGREKEAVQWFWKHMARLPNRIRRDLKVHHEFLALCSTRKCLVAYELHHAALKDVRLM